MYAGAGLTLPRPHQRLRDRLRRADRNRCTTKGTRTRVRSFTGAAINKRWSWASSFTPNDRACCVRDGDEKSACVFGPGPITADFCGAFTVSWNRCSFWAEYAVRILESQRMYRDEQLPLGPPWADVQRLLQELDTDRPRDVRDYAIVLLLAVYGLRAGEVTRLRLSNLDWEHDQLLVPRVKRRAPQTYPLVATVGSRLARYIQEVRPRCPRPEVFLGLRAPHRPLTQCTLYAFIGPCLKRLKSHWLIGVHIP